MAFGRGVAAGGMPKLHTVRAEAFCGMASPARPRVRRRSLRCGASRYETQPMNGGSFDLTHKPFLSRQRLTINYKNIDFLVLVAYYHNHIFP
jgi:hypothetical protein